MNIIDTDAIKDNLRKMINLLEYDSMRSPGKTKLNSQHLHSMIFLLDYYENKPVSKPAQAKKEG